MLQSNNSLISVNGHVHVQGQDPFSMWVSFSVEPKSTPINNYRNINQDLWKLLSISLLISSPWSTIFILRNWRSFKEQICLGGLRCKKPQVFFSLILDGMQKTRDNEKPVTNFFVQYIPVWQFSLYVRKKKLSNFIIPLFNFGLKINNLYYSTFAKINGVLISVNLYYSEDFLCIPKMLSGKSDCSAFRAIARS